MNAIARCLGVLLLGLVVALPSTAHSDTESRKYKRFIASAGHYANALAAHRRGQLERAEKSYLQALEQDPELVEAHVNLARIALDRLAFDAAESHLDQAAVQRPGYPAVYLVRGLVAARKGDHGRALEAFERARQLTPDDPELLTNLGATLLKRGSLVEARRILKRAQRSAPDGPAVQLNLAIANDRAGDHERAAYHYQRFLLLAREDDPGRGAVDQRVHELTGLPVIRRELRQSSHSAPEAKPKPKAAATPALAFPALPAASSPPSTPVATDE